MTENNTKRKSPRHMADFVTALEPGACRDRLARADASPRTGVGTTLTPIAQHTQVTRDGQFSIERTFAGGLYPIRFVGHLDPHTNGGTWVHGAITHDTANQVLIEGLIARIKAERDTPMTVVATGGVASLFHGATTAIDHFDPDLTIRGLLEIHRRNTAART